MHVKKRTFELVLEQSIKNTHYGYQVLLEFYELNDEKHFNIFKQILSIDTKNKQGLFGDVVMIRFEYYIEKLKQFEEKNKENMKQSKYSYSIKIIQGQQYYDFQFRLKQCLSLFQQIDKIFMNENQKPKESQEDQLFKFLHQSLLSSLNKKQNLERINLPFYEKYLEQEGAEFQGLDIFMQFHRCHEFWEVVYLNLMIKRSI